MNAFLEEQEAYKIKGIRLQAKGLLILQVLFLLGWIYAAQEFWDNISAGGTLMYIAWATLVYTILFLVLIINVLVKKAYSKRSTQIKIIIIFALNIIPAMLLLWFAESDIF